MSNPFTAQWSGVLPHQMMPPRGGTQPLVDVVSAGSLAGTRPMLRSIHPNLEAHLTPTNSCILAHYIVYYICKLLQEADMLTRIDRIMLYVGTQAEAKKF